MSARVLVCFAVPREAKPFRNFAESRPDIEVLVTGMGARNAQSAILRALSKGKPQRVLACGFAGALDPTLRIGDVVYLTADPGLDAQLSAAGAKPVSFFCSSRVIITAAEKAQLRATTKADTVEMESAAISEACANVQVPCTTVRAISDAADEDLPLDFNRLMDEQQRLRSAKLALAILKAPHRIPALIKLGQNSTRAANELARVLQAVLAT